MNQVMVMQEQLQHQQHDQQAPTDISSTGLQQELLQTRETVGQLQQQLKESEADAQDLQLQLDNARHEANEQYLQLQKQEHMQQDAMEQVKQLRQQLQDAMQLVEQQDAAVAATAAAARINQGPDVPALSNMVVELRRLLAEREQQLLSAQQQVMLVFAV